MNRQSLSEDAKISDATLRSPEAFAQMAQQFYGRVYFTALGIVRQPDTAEDIAQETFLRAWLKRDTVKEPALLLQPWLVRIATNLALQWLRTGQQRSRLLPLIPMEEVTVKPVDETKPDPRQAAGAAEQRSQVESAVMELPMDLRQVVLLHYAEGLSVREIARMNAEAPSTITRRLEKARLQLRQHLESGIAAGLAVLKPRHGHTQKVFGVITAAAAIPAATRAQLLNLATDTPPPPMIEAVTSAAKAATMEEAGIMKSIIAKVGAAKLIAGAAAIAVVGGGVYGFSTLVMNNSDEAKTAGASGGRATSIRPIGNNAEFRRIAATRAAALEGSVSASKPNPAVKNGKRRQSLSERIALLKDDLVSTQPMVVPADENTSGGTYINMLVVDGSNLPVEGATLQLYKFGYREDSLAGWITLPLDTTGTIRTDNSVIYPSKTNSLGIARVFIPRYTGIYQTRAFSVRATHPDYTATFAEEMDLTSVTKLVMTGGHSMEVIPVDAATSRPVLSGVTPVVASGFQPEWEQRSDGTIAFRKISGNKLLYYLEYKDATGRHYLSELQRIKLPLEVDSPVVLALNPTYEVRGSLSPNVPRPVKNGKVRAQAALASSCTRLAWQEVDVAEDGSFVLTGLPSGEILISGMTDSYNSTSRLDARSTEGVAFPQSFHLPLGTQHYTLPMAARGNLRINVVDADGQPVGGAKIILMSKISHNGCDERWDEDRFAMSDANGHAEITNVAAEQSQMLYVTDGWQLVGKPVGNSGLVDRLELVRISSGETADLTLVAEPETEDQPVIVVD